MGVRPRTGASATEEGAKALYKIPEAMNLLSLSRTVIYEQIRAHRLRTVKVGKSRRVPAGAITDFVALLERENGVTA
ncbi:helix-turn-helix domain-containing protein [Hamadaea tsunoensis]|uniref:helix-turn-helix domain-containing protein n=1 Tax=Hamadaea tsunoensis TaxID=53368 RepID=UPI0024801A7A|nr:helix-turn-helix domain-containing protein [Hamadaea tsunoensis]